MNFRVRAVADDGKESCARPHQDGFNRNRDSLTDNGYYERNTLVSLL